MGLLCNQTLLIFFCFAIKVKFLHIFARIITTYPSARPIAAAMAIKRFPDCTYTITGGIRSVLPYIHEFKSYAKGRWLGRELLEVLTKEFGAHPSSYWKAAIKGGHVRINNAVVQENYIFRNSDELLHRTHRQGR